MKRLFVLVVTVLAFVAFVFGFLGFGTAHAQAKPSLAGSLVAGAVDCPSESGRCLILSQGKRWFLVKGKGFGHEEAIWLLDLNKIKEANELTPTSHYLKLLWRAKKEMV